MATDLSHTALIIIDNQSGTHDPEYWGTSRSNPSYLSNVARLLQNFRLLVSDQGPHIFHICHHSIHPQSPLHPSKMTRDFHPLTTPLKLERVIAKSTNSAFVRPELGALLYERKIWKVYFVGLSVDMCVGSTVRHASDLGVLDHIGEDGKVVKGDIVLVEDAVAAWAKHGGKFDAETVHGVSVESLRGEFARVTTTDLVLKEIGL